MDKLVFLIMVVVLLLFELEVGLFDFGGKGYFVKLVGFVVSLCYIVDYVSVFVEVKVKCILLDVMCMVQVEFVKGD